MCTVCVGEFVSANSALEEVYGVLRSGYADVIESSERNESNHDRTNYDDDEDVWRILDFEENRSQSFHLIRRWNRREFYESHINHSLLVNVALCPLALRSTLSAAGLRRDPITVLSPHPTLEQVAITG